jgi:hypothetical protein
MSNLVAPGVALMEMRMVDSCVITRDPEQRYDDVMDPVTLELFAPANDNSVIYEGKCIFKPMTRKDVNFVQGHDPQERKMFLVRIPISVSDITIGDVVTITAVAEDNDQMLLNKPMRIGKIEGSSYGTSRHLHAELVQQDKGNLFS